MLEQAVAELGIDIANSVMIGDRETDILAGKNAGVARTVLVKTGYGAREVETTTADAVVEDVCAAVKLLLNYY
jgi:D-glycero-D-manno-heptose 1,7-bisphosphate phosphatase